MLQLKILPLDTKIAILGFGKEGKSSLQFLLSQNFSNITILDSRNDVGIIPRDITSMLGASYMDNLDSFELIIKSPGISPYRSELTPYKSKILSQIQIFFEYYKGKVIGITGTKGKSTISSLLTCGLLQAGLKAKLVGNIGMPVLDEIDVFKDNQYDYVVYEMSSYMLEGYSPDLYIGFINNIYECHLDWHGNMDNYSQAKRNILPISVITITHTSVDGGRTQFPTKDGFSYRDNSFYYKGEVFLHNPQMNLLGVHNKENICGVLSVLSIIIPNVTKLKNIFLNTLIEFSPLSHRLENIGVYKDITFIDDGAAVTPEATISAILALDNNTETLLIGGKDLGTNQQELKNIILKSNIKNIAFFPDTGYTLFKSETDGHTEEVAFTKTVQGKDYIFLKTRSVENAVIFAYKYTNIKKTVLLSSAAQSYSLWKSFEEKGALYKKYIRKHAEI